MIPQKRMPSVMGPGDRFAKTAQVSADRSVFDRSCGYKTMFDSGLLIPIFCEYAMPGDTFDVRMTAVARLTTPIKPFMDNMHLDTFFFFVPFRLLWTNFVKFMGEQANPGDSIAFTIPQSVSPGAGWAIGRIADYFGLPTVGVPAITAPISVSALPGRAYNLIYNQWFRDQNLINSIAISLGDGPDAGLYDVNPYKRGKRHDYFTSCLPFLQKGTAAASVVGPTAVPTAPTFRNLSGTVSGGLLSAGFTGDVSATNVSSPVGNWTANETMYWDATGLTVLINDLRTAIATQQYLEAAARGGTRYIELVHALYGVESSDARQQRAEYLGGGSTPIVIAPVAQTSQAAVPTFKDGLANLGAVGAVLASGHGFSKSFEEHGVVIGIVNVRADLTYSQGVERQWSYLNRLDFPVPLFANLSEQAVLNKEIFATGAAADALVFGYQERYAERRYKPSKVTGLFRPTATGTLEVWHLSEKFSALPTLGQTFIEDQTETVLDTRVSVPAEPDWYFDAWFEFKNAALLPVFGTPGMARL